MDWVSRVRCQVDFARQSRARKEDPCDNISRNMLAQVHRFDHASRES